VSADGEEVRPARDRDPARAGARIDVHQRAHVVGTSDHLGDRLDGADLVVGETDRDQCCGGWDVVGGGLCVLVDSGHLHRVTFRLQASHRSQHRLVLGGPRHDEPAFREASSGTEEGQVHCLGAGRGERDLRAIGAQRLGG